jgi:hypothetical protein
MELNNSNYLKQTIEPYFVIIFYAPGPHRVYCELLDNKKSTTTANAYKNFKKYVCNELPE